MIHCTGVSLLFRETVSAYSTIENMRKMLYKHRVADALSQQNTKIINQLDTRSIDRSCLTKFLFKVFLQMLNRPRFHAEADKKPVVYKIVISVVTL